MVRRTLLLISLLYAFAGAGAQAQQQAVVVELFTSQGCSSCPPADQILTDLAPRDDVIALALHVDYWDYIGWKDIFADPGHTKRQKAYAKAVGSRTIYTPQFVVAGDAHVIGNRPMKLAEKIQQAAAQSDASGVRLVMKRAGSKVEIRAVASRPIAGGAVLYFVTYLPEKTVDIGRGENAGRTLTYSNIVTSWQALASWDGAAPLQVEAAPAQAGNYVAILQKERAGPILAAARLR